MSQTNQNTIGIVGAGVMGRVLAWQLCQAGFVVSLFDKDPIETGSAAAYTAAGMLTPYCEVESAELMVYHMGMNSLKLWQQLATELGDDIGYYQSGSLVVAHGNDRPDYLQFSQQVKTKLQPTNEQFRELNQQQLALIEPELAPRFNEAAYLPEEAWLCAERTMRTLGKKLKEIGARWFENTRIDKVSAHTVITQNETHHFDCVIDCRGLGAKLQWNELRGVRGELIWLQAPEVNIKRLVRLMHPRYRLYLVPKGYDDLYIVGATQIESNDAGAMTVRSSLELLSAVYSLHSGFAEARVVEMRTNCRPALNDNLPKIECTDGLIRVNGLYRHGYLLSPTLAQEVTHFLTQPNYQSRYDSLIELAA